MEKNPIINASKLIYLLKTPIRRWKNERDIIYVLDMPIGRHDYNGPLEIIKITSFNQIAREFALERQGEDPEIQGSDYAATVEKRLRQGHVLYLGKMQDGSPGASYAGAAFAGYTKFFLEAVRYWLTLPEHCVAMYDSYTAPSRRGKRYFSQVWNAALDDCAAHGFTSAWGFIMPHNIHSFIIHQKLGLAHIIQKITLRQRWGFRWHRVVKMDCYSHDIIPEIRNLG